LLATACYLDADSDGYGTGSSAITTLCRDVTRASFGECPSGYSNVAGDCNDGNASRSPARTETCNGVDDDCDGSIDESLIAMSCYLDSDGDGYGAGPLLTTLCADSARSSFGSCPSGYSNQGAMAMADCNDANPAVSPGRTEVCNNIDDDCDATVDESLRVTCAVDGDSDGFGAGTTSSQCRDSARTSVGFCPVGYSNVTTDCNDTLSSVRPMGAEACNGLDDDCDGMTDEGVLVTYYRDADGDGFGLTATTATGCSPPAGFVAASGDCNDADASIRPGAPEICDGVDQNCAAGITDESRRTFYRDADGDLYGAAGTTMSACSPPSGFVEYAGDCNDANANVRPGVADLCNGVDDDCDATIDDGAAVFCGAENPLARNVTAWACTAGACTISTCSGAFRNCSGGITDGCETNTASDTTHCGSCGNTCGIAALCESGACEGIRDLFAGGNNTCITRATSGRLVCWGAGERGELNDFSLTDSLTPTVVSGLVDIATGDIGDVLLFSGASVFAVSTDDATFAWGKNGAGQLGLGNNVSPSLPASFLTVSSAQAAVGLQHACLRRGTQILCAGDNPNNELGTTAVTFSWTMRAIGGPAVEYTDVSSGYFSSCARTANAGGQVYCWGDDSQGQIGNGATTTGDTTPVLVSGLTSPTDVECGNYHACALQSAGSVRCWGNNGSGQLGNGTTTDQTAPVTVSGALVFSSLSLGADHSCGIVSGGVRCWGADGSGQLGNGATLANQSVPVAVSGMTGTVVDVAAGGVHTCARTSDHRVYCWGNNSFGQLGLGDTTNRPTPVLVPGL
jgi:alpha-tubulin suppressor-like RCC1 family protein